MYPLRREMPPTSKGFKKGVSIASIDAKDILLANYANLGKVQEGYRLKCADGNYNIRRFKASLDYSLELIKLREVYFKVYRNSSFSFMLQGKEYSPEVVVVTFHYAVRAYNRLGNNTYVKLGVAYTDVELTDGVMIKDGELIAVKVGVPVENPLPQDLLGKYFKFEDGCYSASTNIPTIHTVAEIRKMLYENGFCIDGRKFCRFKRSAGSARVGKCLFIDEALYSRMHRWELCGLKFKRGDAIDLASFESYISLTTSSITGTLEIQPNNILLIDDYENTFKDKVVNVKQIDDHLEADEEEVDVTNSIWDGQSLIDPSIMGENAVHGFILLRNRFFKSAAFNCNIQQFFKDNGITSVSQLKGKTIAKNIEDIKFILCPSSIKYMKFGSFESWLENIDPLFGVVKHEKPPHYFGGKLVSTHYQLLNTLQMSQEEVDEFLTPTLKYMNLLKTDPAVLRYHLKWSVGKDEITVSKTRNDVVYNMLGITDKFVKTRLYYDFMYDILRAYSKNTRCGHVLVNGNYSVLCGNPVEMLLETIGKFDGTAIVKPGTVQSKRFDYGTELISSRSPHVTMGNVMLSVNTEYPDVSKYMNLTEGIVVVNSIGENTLSRLSGADRHIVRLGR